MSNAPTTPAGAQTSAHTGTMPVSYPRASRWRDLIAFDTGNKDLPTAGGLSIGGYNLPQLGFATELYLLVTIVGTNTSTTTVAATDDSPFAILSAISLSDQNGAPLFGPLTGYQAYLTNKWGGYHFSADPKSSPNYSAISTGTGTTAGSGTFEIILPITDSQRDFFCALPNADASAAYTVEIITAALSDIYSTAPSGGATIRVQGTLRSRTVPPPTDTAGNPLTQLPVGVSGGKASTQYWNRQSISIGSGQQTVQSKRLGNVIRKLIFVLRKANVRDSTDWYNPMRWLINNTPERVMSQARWTYDMAMSYGYHGTIDTANGLDTGVFVLDYQNQIGHPSPAELRDFYLPTKNSTLLQLDGEIGSTASTYNLEILTNDISPAPGAPVSTSGA